MTTALLEFLETLTFPVGQQGDLIGATVQGQEGAAASVQLNGQAISYPVTLKASDVLTLTRAQASADPDYRKITRLYGTRAATPGGGTVTFEVTGQDGYQTISSGGATAGPYPTRVLFEGLQAQVSTIKQSDANVARLQDSGPDSVYVLGGDAAPLAVKMMQLYYSVNDPVPRLMTELRVQVPDGATVPSSTVGLEIRRAGEGAPRPAAIFGMEVLMAAGKTWLSIKTRTMVGPDDQVRVTFDTPYSLLVSGNVVSNPTAMVIDASGQELDPAIGMHYVTEGKRTIVGQLAADAMRVVDAPTPFNKMRDGDFEIVQPSALDALSGQVPYLRLRVREMEYKLPFEPA